jgi:Cu(I)/Ag(I) efflux system membrane fusion protein
MKYFFALCLLTLTVVSCKNKDEKKETTVTEEKNTSGGIQYSETFITSFNNVLNAYYNLKDAFVKSDTVAVNAAGAQLKTLLDSLKLDEVQQKDTVAFSSISGRPGDASAEIAGMLAEKDLEKKRESFEMISSAFYDLIRAVRPGGVTAYYQYCPMAFNDKGAYWLSNADSIRNPYFGKKMLTCGEVKETLKY